MLDFSSRSFTEAGSKRGLWLSITSHFSTETGRALLRGHIALLVGCTCIRCAILVIQRSDATKDLEYIHLSATLCFRDPSLHSVSLWMTIKEQRAKQKKISHFNERSDVASKKDQGPASLFYREAEGVGWSVKKKKLFER